MTAELRIAPARAPASLDARSDEDLMVASAADSREAFELVVARYLPRVTSYCAKLVRDPVLAQELAQDAMLALWRTRRDYRPERPLRVLVFTIALNLCRNHARSWRRRLRWLGFAADEPDALDALPAPDGSHLDQLLDHERRRRVRAALDRLPARAREVLLLRFEQDLSYADIGAIMRVREVTARSQVFHALRKLERALEEDV